MKSQIVMFEFIFLTICGFCFANCLSEQDSNSGDGKRELTGLRGKFYDETSTSVPEYTGQAEAQSENEEYQLINQELNQPGVKQYKMELPQQQQQQQECKPMFNLDPYYEHDLEKFDFLNRTTTTATGIDNSRLNFSLDIGDIDMPVAPPSGSINSAIKLLSSFNEQFEPESSQDTESAAADNNMVKFRDNNLKIDGLNLTMLNIHLYPNNDPKFGVGITIKNTTLSGRFSYKGPALLTSSTLSGFYRMRIENIFVVATSNLTKQKFLITSEQKERMSSIRKNGYELISKDLRVNITNLGFISIDILDSANSGKQTSNYLLRMLQRVLQKSIKRTYYSFEGYIRDKLEEESRKALDCELTRFTPLLANSTISSSQSEDFSRIISSEMLRLQYDHVTLPDFDYHQSVFGRNATIQFYNGSLNGLSNMKLSGETRIKLQEEHLFVNTSIGWTNLKPYYNWSLFTGNNNNNNNNINNTGSTTGGNRTPMGKGFVSFDIRAVDFDSVITKGLRPHTRIVVDQLNIRWLENPKMDIGGLPGMNRITRGIVNLFMGQLKKRISAWIQPALKQQLEKSLNKMKLFNSF